MPNRYVREGIIDSESVNALTFQAEILYRRLMSIADDYGRYSANPALLIGKMFSLQADRWNPAALTSALNECVEQGLIKTYTVEGKLFLEIQNFEQQIRSDSKFPAPPWGFVGKCKQVQTGCKQMLTAPIPNTSSISSSISDSDSDSVTEDGADAPTSPPQTFAVQSELGLKVFDGEVVRELRKTSELETVIAKLAERIHARHPQHRRDLGVRGISERLKTIANKFPKNQRTSKLLELDDHHQKWCEGPWTEEAGKYAKGLENWLCPSKTRWDADPPVPITAKPAEPQSIYAPYVPPRAVSE